MVFRIRVVWVSLKVSADCIASHVVCCTANSQKLSAWLTRTCTVVLRCVLSAEISFIMAELAQVERCYQKQPTIFQNKKRVLGRRVGRSELRFTRSVGLGFKTPRHVSVWPHGGGVRASWAIEVGLQGSNVYFCCTTLLAWPQCSRVSRALTVPDLTWVFCGVR